MILNLNRKPIAYSYKLKFLRNLEEKRVDIEVEYRLDKITEREVNK